MLPRFKVEIGRDRNGVPGFAIVDQQGTVFGLYAAEQEADHYCDLMNRSAAAPAARLLCADDDCGVEVPAFHPGAVRS